MKQAMTIFMWALIMPVSVLSGQGNAAYSPHRMAATSDEDGGGACSLNKNADFSPELLMLLLVSVVYLSRRKQRNG